MAANERDEAIARIRAKLVEMASSMGNDASGLGEAEIIPDSGVIDSAGLMEFVIWYDDAFGLNLQPEEMTVDNLGTLAGMADFALARRRAAAR